MKDKEKLALFNHSIRIEEFCKKVGSLITIHISRRDQLYYTWKNIKNRFFPSRDDETKALPEGEIEDAKRNIKEEVHDPIYTEKTNAVSYEYAARVANNSNEEKEVEEVEKE